MKERPAQNLGIAQVAPDEVKGNKIPDDIIHDIITNLADSYGTTAPFAYVAVLILFLKGAFPFLLRRKRGENAGCSDTTEAKIIDSGSEIVIRKRDLMYNYQKVTSKKYLRRLAESLAVRIGQYAERNDRDGDIANKINNRLVSGEG